MGKVRGVRRSCRVGFLSAVALACLVAACGPRVDGPAPVISSEATAEPPPGLAQVQRGQTLSGIAHSYHVPLQSIAAANHLAPPYKIEAGRTLIIPGAGQADAPAAPVSVAALPVAQPGTAALPSRTEGVALDRRPPAPVEKPTVATVPPPSPVPPAPPTTDEPARPAAKPSAAATEPPPTTAPSAPARGSGTFPWPVRGHVLASFGSGADGTHNDGINIAAPRGAAVQAVDAGVVAYTGNELRGYGNLVLVKHASGWISAYAHCDLVLVKRGDKVTRGQVIARVGSTGNVGEPQLHFELRRGNRPVDPREYLTPLPSVGTDKGPRAG
jgi:murein DD-endopeptidase MepM/ murein hydrolase activator NlpD